MNMHTIEVVTHRGCEPSRMHFYDESSLEAFSSQLSRGFGLEFDFNLTADNQVVLLHDQNLSRVSHGLDRRVIRDISASALQKFHFSKGSICFFESLAPLLIESKVPHHAFHIKGTFQSPRDLEIVLQLLNKYPLLRLKLILFDLKPDSAQYLRSNFPDLLLAASVADEYDISRYNQVVHGTLLSLSAAIEHRDAFNWVWLDEWDLTGPGNTTKMWYTAQIFSALRTHDFKIGLVTPELHGTSPGLLGGEKHPDSQDHKKLFTRIKKILALEPDLVCTDYPEEVRKLIKNF